MFTNINGCRAAEDVVPISCLCVIWMAIIRSGGVLRPRTDVLLKTLTSQLCLVAISWLVLNELLSLLVGRYGPTKAIRVCNNDNPWFDDQCRSAFGLEQEAHIR